MELQPHLAKVFLLLLSLKARLWKSLLWKALLWKALVQ